ncbi:MAG: hypothetical protein HFE36_02155 [Clostridia bacterium]|nr:hypothetical protein [Clostridia bacterium]
MTKVTTKKTAVSLLCVCALLLALVAAFAGGGVFNPVSSKAEQTYKLDLTSGIKATCGQPSVDTASNVMYFKFGGGLNMTDGSKMELNEIVPAGEGTEATTLGDYLEITCTEGVNTVNGWKSKGKSFRIACYGAYFLLQFENNSMGNGVEVTSVKFKRGFTLFEGGTSEGDWVFTHKCDKKVEGSEFEKDVSLHLNRTTGMYEHLVGNAEGDLQTAGDANKTQYLEGEAFDPTGLTLTVKSADGDTFTDIPVTAAMCSAIGEDGTVTISYGGKTVTYKVQVQKATEELQSIAMKEGYKIEYKKFDLNTSTVSGTVVATVLDTESNQTITRDIPLTADMIVSRPDTTESGTKKVTVSYSLLNVTETVEADATVLTEKVSSNIVGVEYDVADGVVSDNRHLGFKFENNSYMNTLTTNWRTNASVIPDKTLGDLVEIKYSDETATKTLTEINGAIISVGDRLLLQNAEKANATVDYIIVRAGFLMYSGSNGAAPADMVPHVAPNGKLSVVTEDFYIGYSSTDKNAKYGKIVKPVKNLVITVANGAQTEYFVGEELNLTGVTYSADYVNPAETAKLSGSVTKDMCTAIPDTAGDAVITVSLNNATATFNIKVKEATKELKSVALKEGSVITYKKFALEPESGCKLIATFEDKTTHETTTEEIELLPSMVTVRPDTSVAGEDKTATVAYKALGKTVQAALAAKVENTVTETKILGIHYGETNNVNNQFGIKFNIVTGGADGLKAIDNIGGLGSVIPGKTLGDLMLIKFTKKTEPIALSATELNKLQPAFYGGGFVLRELNTVKESHGDVEYIIIKAGFVWYSSTKDTWGQGDKADTKDYFPVATNVFTQDLYAGFLNGLLVNPVKSITAVLPEGYKTEYMQGEALSVKDVLVRIEYVNPDLKSESIALTADMCGAITGDSSAAQAEITYMGKTYTITGLTLSDERVTGIEVTKAGKTEYAFLTDKFDISGYEISMVIENVTTNATRKQAIEHGDIVVSGYSDHDLGEQTVKFTYGDFETEQKITTVNGEPNKYLSVDYISNYNSYESTQHKGLIVNVGFEGMSAPALKVFWQGEKLPNVANKVMINGKLASDLIANGSLDSIRFWSNQIVFMFYTDKMQPTKSSDKYVEGTTELVEKVTFLPGFQFYATSVDIWGTSWTMDDITLIPHAVIKTELTLENVNYGMGWVRELKKDGDSVAADAITIGSMPNKTTFKVGEKLNASDLLPGLQLHFKYADGGEEDIIPGISDIEFDNNVTATAGKKTVTVYFKSNDYYATFEIEVVGENAAAESETGCGCSGSVISGSTALAAICLLGAMAAITFAKRKERN